MTTSSADFFGNFGCGLDRNAAAIVDDREPAVRLQRHFDEGRVAGHGLVHGVVQHLGEEVMHRRLVGAADIHAGAPADGLEPLQHLDRGGGIFRRPALWRRVSTRAPCAARRRTDRVLKPWAILARFGRGRHGPAPSSKFQHPHPEEARRAVSKDGPPRRIGHRTSLVLRDAAFGGSSG